MRYMIADPDVQMGVELKRILDAYEILNFQGSYKTLQQAGKWSLEQPPDMAFIRLGKAGLNALQLAEIIRECNPISKIVFYSSRKESAVEAFEYEADGFLLMPFDRDKIEQFLQHMVTIEKRK